MIPNAMFRAVLVFALSLAAARAEVRLHNLFTDHMVLQQGTKVPVWGWADEGETVTVEFRGQKVSATAKDGRWMVQLKKLKPGPAETMKVSGRRAGQVGGPEQHSMIEVRDVLVGEVWLASGQSNMEFAMRGSFNSSNDIAQSANPNIRLFTVPKLKLNAPTNNVKSKWVECEPETVPGFSAVGYYFARDLQKALGVPVGVIHTSWGGSPAEVWIREQLMMDDKEYKRHPRYLRGFPRQIPRFSRTVEEREGGRRGSRPALQQAPAVRRLETSRAIQRHDRQRHPLRHQRSHLVSG